MGSRGRGAEGVPNCKALVNLNANILVGIAFILEKER